MALKIRRADYFYFTIKDRPGEAYQILSHLAAGEVNLLAFAAVPLGPQRAQLTLFPDRIEQLAAYAEKTGLGLDGPHPAILVQGDDRLGALAEVHSKLAMSKINVYASTGVTDGSGTFGYVLYVQARDIQDALAALGQ